MDHLLRLSCLAWQEKLVDDGLDCKGTFPLYTMLSTLSFSYSIRMSVNYIHQWAMWDLWNHSRSGAGDAAEGLFLNRRNMIETATTAISMKLTP